MDRAGGHGAMPGIEREAVIASADLEAAPTPDPDGSLVPEDVVSAVAAWRSVAVLLLLIVLSMLDRQIIALQIGPMKADLSLTDTQIGLLQGLAFGLCYAFAGLPLGWAVDRFSRRRVAFLGVVTWSLSSAACGLAGGFWQLFAARTLVGAGEASLNPTAVSLIGDLFPRGRTGIPMGIYSAGIYLGSGVALAVGGFVIGLFAGEPAVRLPILGDLAPWQAVFLVTGLPGVVIAFAAFLMREPRHAGGATRATSPRDRGSMLRFGGDHAALLFHTFIGFGLASSVFYSLAAWTPAYLTRSFGWPAGRVGWTWGLVVASTGIFGSLIGGIVIDRAYRAGMRDACLVVPAIGALLAWPFIAGAYFVPSPSAMLSVLGIGLVLFGVIGPGSYAAWARIAPPALRGRVTAGFTLVTGVLGSGLGPVAVALLTDRVFHDEAKVGASIAIVASLALPVLALLLLSGRAALRRHPA